MEPMTSNVFDCALIFEGGGMRASYSSAIANALLDEGIYFDHVYGVSAGASNTVNYLSRDAQRTYESFTTFADDPHFGGWSSFIAHKGLFNAPYIYQESALPQARLPFDMEAFLANPAKATLVSLERDTGKTRLFTREDMQTLEGLMVAVRASSTLPIAMPPLTVDGQVLYDGGLGAGHGIALPQAVDDGFSKFFVVRTRPKGFRKPEEVSEGVMRFFWQRPAMRQALLEWGIGYNSMCDLLEQLEEEGRALVVYAEDQTCENTTRDVVQLKRNYDLGARQAKRDLGRWLDFLGK